MESTSHGLFDMVNCFSGRDHGLPTYNGLRVAMGLSAKTTFAQVTSSASLQAKLAKVYATVDDIDPWVGALSEDREAGSSVGELVGAILQDQFTRLIQGDPFFWKWDPDLQAQFGNSGSEMVLLSLRQGGPSGVSGFWNPDQVTMSKLIQDNTIHSNLNSNAFRVV
jgi:Animal haem peroxidase